MRGQLLRLRILLGQLGLRRRQARIGLSLRGARQQLRPFAGRLGRHLRIAGGQLRPHRIVGRRLRLLLQALLLYLPLAQLGQPRGFLLLRLLIGSDAVHYAAIAAEDLAASDEKWRDLSVSASD